MAVAHEASSAVRLEPAVSETAERLFNEHSGWIYGYCLRLLRSPEEAEDALQATYLNACKSLKEGIQPHAESAWLLRIAQNTCLTRLRSSGRRARLERVQDVGLLEETVAAPDRTADELIGLVDALGTLPEQQRRAILLREWQGLSYAEVAATLELTQSAVETLIFRARRSLATALENPAKRRRLRFAHALDVAGLYAAIKGFFAANASAALVAAALVAATTATVAATDPVDIWGGDARPPTSAAKSRGGSAAPAQANPGYPGLDAGVPVVFSAHPFDAVERAPFAVPGGPAAAGHESGREFGQARAEAAQEQGELKGKHKALGHAKHEAKAKKEKTPHGQGTPAGGKPDAAGTHGPPAHATAAGKSAEDEALTDETSSESDSSGDVSQSGASATGLEKSGGKAAKSLE
jgi:RNA polymerase sigma factor (sigma-70 family)